MGVGWCAEPFPGSWPCAWVRVGVRGDSPLEWWRTRAHLSGLRWPGAHALGCAQLSKIRTLTSTNCFGLQAYISLMEVCGFDGCAWASQSAGSCLARGARSSPGLHSCNVCRAGPWLAGAWPLCCFHARTAPAREWLLCTRPSLVQHHMPGWQSSTAACPMLDSLYPFPGPQECSHWMPSRHLWLSCSVGSAHVRCSPTPPNGWMDG